MPLLTIFESAPESVGKFSIEQVVSAAGDGALKDGSACAEELRGYRGRIPTEKIAEYVTHCLTAPFAKSGMVLQDLVNELGRRLDYQVLNGRYQGIQGHVGFDGLWTSPEAHSLVVEVKTTDAYRISLDTLAAYREKLEAAGKLAPQSSILIIVGRQDTGELEAQIRGSRHAWDIRLISVESLIKLLLLKENAGATETGLKMRSLLTPIEYTRLDRMVDVMFATATDLEEDSGLDVGEPLEDEANGASTIDAAELPAVPQVGVRTTDGKLLQSKREAVVSALGQREHVSLIKKSRALYWDSHHSVRAACAMSKRYTGKGQAPYWFAYHAHWREFLAEVTSGFFLLGCMDKPYAFAIPYSVMEGMTPHLHKSVRPAGAYWHVHLLEQSGSLALQVPKAEALDVSPFKIAVG